MKNRFRSSRFGRSIGLAYLAITAWCAVPVRADTVLNGDFETGSLDGWVVVDTGSGGWFAYAGQTSPLSGFLVAPPPEGNFAAITDQFGPGSHILYQDVVLQGPVLNLEPITGCKHTLSFLLYYENRAGVFYTPDSLDSANAGPNQQYRVDVLDPSADPDSVAPADVLAQVFQTHAGDPVSLEPTSMSFDLSPFDGTTVRLRLAEVDNQFYFQASVDAVQIERQCDLVTCLIETVASGNPDPTALGACISSVSTFKAAAPVLHAASNGQSAEGFVPPAYGK